MRLTRLLAGQLVMVASMFGADPFVGSWTLNFSKSKLPSSMADIKENTLTVEATGSGQRLIEEVTRSDGRKQRTVNTIIIDGKDHPATARSSGKEVPNTLMSFRRSDERHLSGSIKRDGQEIQTIETVVSQDGKTMTSTTRGRIASGQDLDMVEVYDRK